MLNVYNSYSFAKIPTRNPQKLPVRVTLRLLNRWINKRYDGRMCSVFRLSRRRRDVVTRNRRGVMDFRVRCAILHIYI